MGGAHVASVGSLWLRGPPTGSVARLLALLWGRLASWRCASDGLHWLPGRRLNDCDYDAIQKSYLGYDYDCAAFLFYCLC